MGSKLNKFLKLLLKFTLSWLALWFVFSKVSLAEVASLVYESNFLLLILAVVFFVASKVLSAFRLNLFFKGIKLNLANGYNLRLYWIGMFYNLFLPGGIGGDGYKVYLLNKQYGTKVKDLVRVSLIDRFSGLVSLLFLVGISALFLDLSFISSWVRVLDIICLVLVFPVFLLLVKFFFNPFLSVLGKAMVLSFGVQSLQVISAVFILLAIGVENGFIAYTVLFLVSSFVSILPFTIGGLGSREFTFLIGYQYFGIDENLSVTLSLSFTLISALVSFLGIFVKIKKGQSS